MNKERFIDIDCAKGLAIVLVVIGHIVARGYPINMNGFTILNNRFTLSICHYLCF